MKRVASILLVIAMMAAILTVSLTGCGLFKSVTLEEAKTNLTNAGYQVTVMTGREYVEMEDAFPAISDIDLDYYLYAVKGNDVIHMFFFDSVDSASDNANFINDPDLLGGQSNQLVYLATKQARTDAGL